jgi:hypothetical protein
MTRYAVALSAILVCTGAPAFAQQWLVAGAHPAGAAEYSPASIVRDGADAFRVQMRVRGGDFLSSLGLTELRSTLMIDCRGRRARTIEQIGFYRDGREVRQPGGADWRPIAIEAISRIADVGCGNQRSVVTSPTPRPTAPVAAAPARRASGPILGGTVGAVVNGRQYYRDPRGFCYYVDGEGQPHYNYDARC